MKYENKPTQNQSYQGGFMRCFERFNNDTTTNALNPPILNLQSKENLK